MDPPDKTPKGAGDEATASRVRACLNDKAPGAESLASGHVHGLRYQQDSHALQRHSHSQDSIPCLQKSRTAQKKSCHVPASITFVQSHACPNAPSSEGNESEDYPREATDAENDPSLRCFHRPVPDHARPSLKVRGAVKQDRRKSHRPQLQPLVHPLPRSTPFLAD